MLFQKDYSCSKLIYLKKVDKMHKKMVGIRGAINIDSDTINEIKAKSVALFKSILNKNEIESDDIISLIVSVTSDITTFNPATAIRESGFDKIPLFCVREAEFQNSAGKIIRVLLHVRFPENKTPIHVYLGEAIKLRPDIV